MKPHASLFACAPTTTGTSSDVSGSAVIAASGDGYKLMFRSAEMSAARAHLDRELRTSAPASATDASGFGAVTLAVVAFTARR